MSDPPLDPPPTNGHSTISAAEFALLQQQLMSVKEQLYETKRQAEVATREKMSMIQGNEHSACNMG